MATKVRLTARHRGWLLNLLMLYFTFLGGNFISDHSLGPRIFHHTLMTLLLGGWMTLLLVKRRPWPVTPMDLPLAAFFGVNVLATIFAVDTRISVEELWRLLTHILLFYIIVDLMRATRPRVVIEPLLFASSVVILIGVMEFTSWYAGIPRLPLFAMSWLDVGGLQQPIPPNIYRLSFTMLIATHLSAYMAILIPVGLAWAISAYARNTRRALIFWLVGAVIIEVLSFSRGGLLSLAVSLPILALLTLFGSPEFRARIPLLIRDWRVIVGAGIILVVMAAFAFAWTRQANLSGHASGDILRLDLWNSAWQVGLHKPILGVGPYGFGRAMRLYRNPEVTPDHFITPHNVPLLIWAESGILGVLSLAAMTVALLWSGWQRWKEAQNNERIRVAAALAALIGFSVQSLFDTFTSTTPIMLPAIILLAYLVYPFSGETSPNPVRRWLPALGLLVMVVAAVGWRISNQAQQHFQIAISLRDSNRHEEALAEIDTARMIDPHLGLYAAQKAQILGEMALQDRQYLPQVLEAYEDALRFEDSYDLMLANYGFMLALNGDHQRALEYFERASMIRPKDPLYHLYVAETATNLDQAAVAQDEYRLALKYMPEWVVSPFWDDSLERSSVRNTYAANQDLPDFSADFLTNVPPTCWLLLSDEAAFREENAESTLINCQARLELFIDGNPEKALSLLDSYAATHPSGIDYSLRAETHLRLDNLDAAHYDASMALFLGDLRGHYVLGLLAEQAGDTDTAIAEYRQAGPVSVQLQGWDVAAYNRLGSLLLLSTPEFDAPGRSRYDLAPWIALYRLHERLGQPDAAQNILRSIRTLDPYFMLD